MMCDVMECDVMVMMCGVMEFKCDVMECDDVMMCDVMQVTCHLVSLAKATLAGWLVSMTTSSTIVCNTVDKSSVLLYGEQYSTVL